MISTKKEEIETTNFDFGAFFDKDTAASAVDNFLVTPFQKAADRATVAISSVGEAISDAGEYFLSPLEQSSPDRKKNVSFDLENGIDNTKEGGSGTATIAVDIQPRFDGTGIEIIANNNRADDEDHRPKLLGNSIIRGSTLMFDPIAAEAENGELEPMSLKVLRGNNLPYDHTKIRIGVFNREGSAVDQIIGSTPSSEGNRDPIWGSKSSSWTVNANQSTNFLFSLLAEDDGNGSEIEGKKNGPTTTLCARISASDLLAKPNPNFWIYLEAKDDPENTNADCGRIQIRLTRPTEAKLHKQENCRWLSPGPCIPRVQSYTIRKMALYSCSPVMLNVYDVSNNPRIATINNTTKTFGYGGIFHAAIEIHGKEYSFGGTVNKKSMISGVFQCAPKQCPMHNYRESIFLGDCDLDGSQVQTILKGLRPQWLARSYNMFRRNCAFFSRELAIELGVGDIPEWVFSLATTAETIEPYLHKLNAYLKNRTRANNNQSLKGKTEAAKPGKRVSINTDEDIQAHEVAKNTQEALLDHAMAARIQRSYRAMGDRRAKLQRAKAMRLLQISSPLGTASA